jgi:hypothetical protein
MLKQDVKCIMWSDDYLEVAMSKFIAWLKKHGHDFDILDVTTAYTNADDWCVTVYYKE